VIMGAMLTVWGVALLALARPLHSNWSQMLDRLRGAGFRRPPFGTRFIASPEGLRAMQIAGGCGLAVGAILIAVGLYQR
jgi:hypothetical protein